MERQRLKQELDDMNIRMQKLNDQVLRSLPDIDLYTAPAASSGVWHHTTCPKCKADIVDDTSPCWCFDVACIHCQKQAIFCDCKAQAVCFKVCDECGESTVSDNSKLKWLSELGFPYAGERAGETLIIGSCPGCKYGALRLVPHMVDGLAICGQCRGVDFQNLIVPCESVDCIGDGETMFHEHCMYRHGTGQFQCHPCYNAGVRLDTEDEEDEGSETDESASDDDETKAASRYGGTDMNAMD